MGIQCFQFQNRSTDSTRLPLNPPPPTPRKVSSLMHKDNTVITLTVFSELENGTEGAEIRPPLIQSLIWLTSLHKHSKPQLELILTPQTLQLVYKIPRKINLHLTYTISYQMTNFAYLHQPGHHRNPKNPSTLQTWTLQQEQRKKVHIVNNGAML